MRWLLLFLLCTVVTSCSNDDPFPRCIAGDNFSDVGLTVGAHVPRGDARFKADDQESSDGFHPNQVIRWIDTGYITTGDEIIVRTDGLWTAWLDMGNKIETDKPVKGHQSFDTGKKYEFVAQLSSVPRDRICNPYLYKAPTRGTCDKIRKAPYVEIGKPVDNPAKGEYGPPCWFVNGYGAYILLKRPQDPEPNATLDIMRAPQSPILHLGYEPAANEHFFSTADHPIIDNNCQEMKIERGWKIYAKIMDRFYWNDAGGYAFEFMRGAKKAADLRFLERLRTSVVNILMSGAESMFRRITTNNVYIDFVRALLVLYIVFTGIVYMFGMVQQAYSDVFIRIIKVAVILQLISFGSWEFFYNNLGLLFVNGPAQLIGMLNSHSGVEFNENAPFNAFDDILDILFADVLWTKKMRAFIWTWPPVVVCLVLAVIVLIILAYVIVMIYACIVYLTCMIGIAILIALIPILFLTLLFSKLPNTFENWLKQMCSFVLQSVMVFTLVSLFAALVLNFIYKTFGYTVCYNKTVQFDVCLIVGVTGCFTLAETYAWTFGNNFDYYEVGRITATDLESKKNRVFFNRGGGLMKVPPEYKYTDYRCFDYPYLDPNPDSSDPIPGLCVSHANPQFTSNSTLPTASIASANNTAIGVGKGKDFDRIQNQIQSHDQFVDFADLFTLVLLIVLLWHLRLFVQRLGASIAGTSPFLSVVGHHFENFFQASGGNTLASLPGQLVGKVVYGLPAAWGQFLGRQYDGVTDLVSRAVPTPVAKVGSGIYNVAEWSVGAESDIKAHFREKDAFKWVHHKQAVIGQTLSDLAPDSLVKGGLSYAYNSFLGKTDASLSGHIKLSYAQQLEKLHDNIIGYKRPGVPEGDDKKDDNNYNPFQEAQDSAKAPGDDEYHSVRDPDVSGAMETGDEIVSGLISDHDDGSETVSGNTDASQTLERGGETILPVDNSEHSRVANAISDEVLKSHADGGAVEPNTRDVETQQAGFESAESVTLSTGDTSARLSGEHDGSKEFRPSAGTDYTDGGIGDVPSPEGAASNVESGEVSAERGTLSDSDVAHNISEEVVTDQSENIDLDNYTNQTSGENNTSQESGVSNSFSDRAASERMNDFETATVDTYGPSDAVDGSDGYGVGKVSSASITEEDSRVYDASSSVFQSDAGFGESAETDSGTQDRALNKEDGLSDVSGYANSADVTPTIESGEVSAESGTLSDTDVARNISEEVVTDQSENIGVDTYDYGRQDGPQTVSAGGTSASDSDEVELPQGSVSSGGEAFTSSDVSDSSGYDSVDVEVVDGTGVGSSPEADYGDGGTGSGESTDEAPTLIDESVGDTESVSSAEVDYGRQDGPQTVPEGFDDNSGQETVVSDNVSSYATSEGVVSEDTDSSPGDDSGTQGESQTVSAGGTSASDSDEVELPQGSVSSGGEAFTSSDVSDSSGYDSVDVEVVDGTGVGSSPEADYGGTGSGESTDEAPTLIDESVGDTESVSSAEVDYGRQDGPQTVPEGFDDNSGQETVVSDNVSSYATSEGVVSEDTDSSPGDDSGTQGESQTVSAGGTSASDSDEVELPQGSVSSGGEAFTSSDVSDSSGYDSVDLEVVDGTGVGSSAETDSGTQGESQTVSAGGTSASDSDEVELPQGSVSSGGEAFTSSDVSDSSGYDSVDLEVVDGTGVGSSAETDSGTQGFDDNSGKETVVSDNVSSYATSEGVVSEDTDSSPGDDSGTQGESQTVSAGGTSVSDSDEVELPQGSVSSGGEAFTSSDVSDSSGYDSVDLEVVDGTGVGSSPEADSGIDIFQTQEKAPHKETEAEHFEASVKQNEELKKEEEFMEELEKVLHEDGSKSAEVDYGRQDGPQTVPEGFDDNSGKETVVSDNVSSYATSEGVVSEDTDSSPGDDSGTQGESQTVSAGGTSASDSDEVELPQGSVSSGGEAFTSSDVSDSSGYDSVDLEVVDGTGVGSSAETDSGIDIFQTQEKAPHKETAAEHFEASVKQNEELKKEEEFMEELEKVLHEDGSKSSEDNDGIAPDDKSGGSVASTADSEVSSNETTDSETTADAKSNIDEETVASEGNKDNDGVDINESESKANSSNGDVEIRLGEGEKGIMASGTDLTKAPLMTGQQPSKEKTPYFYNNEKSDKKHKGFVQQQNIFNKKVNTQSNKKLHKDPKGKLSKIAKKISGLKWKDIRGWFFFK